MRGDKEEKSTSWKKFNKNYLDIIDEEKAWFIGLLAADGNISNIHTTLSQSGKNGKKLMEYIKKILGAESKISKYQPKLKNAKITYRINLTSRHFVKELSKYNIVPRKSLIYKFPEKLENKFVKSFIRGYIEGDGCVNECNSKRIVKNKEHVIKNLFISFVGTNDFIKHCSKILPFNFNLYKIKKAKNLYEIRWTGLEAIKFGNWIFSDNKLYKSYKLKIFNNFIKNNKKKEFIIFKEIRTKILQGFEGGMTPLEISKTFSINYKYVHAWKNKVDKLRKLCYF